VYVDRYAAGRFLRIYVREHAIGTTSPSPGRDLILWLRFATVPSIILANPPASIAQRNQRPTLFQQSELAQSRPAALAQGLFEDRRGGAHLASLPDHWRIWARVVFPHTSKQVPACAQYCVEIRTGQLSLGTPTNLHGSKSGQSGRATRTPRTLGVGIANSSAVPQIVPSDIQDAPVPQPADSLVQSALTRCVSAVLQLRLSSIQLLSVSQQRRERHAQPVGDPLHVA
jgi:hypothetical protein